MISPLLGKILEEYSEGSNRIGLVEFDGKRRPIYLYLVPEAHAGDFVRFHAGFATERVTVTELPSRPAPRAIPNPSGPTSPTWALTGS